MKQLVEKCQSLLEKYNVVWDSSFLQWDLPTGVEADLALSLAITIAYKTKTNVQEIAKEIVQVIDFPGWKFVVTSLGHINITLPIDYYECFLVNNWQSDGAFLQKKQNDCIVNIEYVSCNPTGYLHIAHFRQAFFGDALANIYKNRGYKVVREFYINDRGTQIDSLAFSVNYYYHQLLHQKTDIDKTLIEYRTLASQDAAKHLAQKWGDKYVGHKLEGALLELWKKEIISFFMNKIYQDLETCGIFFDVWSSEKSYYGNKNSDIIREFLASLHEKNLVYEKEGAVFFRSSLFTDSKDRVIITQDGRYTYFFSDIIYHIDKLKRANRLIDIYGADHHGYVDRVSSACQLLGYSANRIQIILIQMVSLLALEGTTSRFSKRAGNTIELSEALTHIDKEQLRFFCLEKDSNQPLIINTNLLKEQQKETRLYYLQYAHARCHQLFKKAEVEQMIMGKQLNLLGTTEKKILNLLIRSEDFLEKALLDNKPHHLVYYLLDLAKQWQVYYQQCHILDRNRLQLTSQKMLMVKNIQIILNLGLRLLGIVPLDFVNRENN